MDKKDKMSDLDKELNFDDIAGKKTSVSSKKKSSYEVSGKTEALTGTVIAIPTANPDSWINKDLSECTGKEFVTWAKGVYPVDLKEFTEKLDSLAYRINTFKGILNYHINSPFQMGRDNKRNTTSH